MQTQNLMTISVRDFLRDYKATVGNVIASGFPVVVTNRQTPQVAVVDLKSLDRLQKANQPNTAQALLELAKRGEEISRKFKIKGPKDLSVNHDKYTWGPYE